jgi:hypothetical protein
VTDFDAVLDGAKKSKEEAEKRGKTRRDNFNALFGLNPWVTAFYAPHTLEVDFADIEHNREYIKSVIAAHYSEEKTITNHQNNLDKSAADRYDSVLTFAGSMGKGWYATMLASKLDHEVVIPDYLLGALAFASQEVVTYIILKKMAINILEKYAGNPDKDTLKQEFIQATSDDAVEHAIVRFCGLMPDSSYSGFIRHRRDLGLHG